MKFPKIKIKDPETQFENSKNQFTGTFLRGLLNKFLTNNVRILCLKRVKLTLKLIAQGWFSYFKRFACDAETTWQVA